MSGWKPVAQQIAKRFAQLGTARKVIAGLSVLITIAAAAIKLEWPLAVATIFAVLVIAELIVMLDLGRALDTSLLIAPSEAKLIGNRIQIRLRNDGARAQFSAVLDELEGADEPLIDSGYVQWLRTPAAVAEEIARGEHRTIVIGEVQPLTGLDPCLSFRAVGGDGVASQRGYRIEVGSLGVAWLSIAARGDGAPDYVRRVGVTIRWDGGEGDVFVGFVEHDRV